MQTYTAERTDRSIMLGFKEINSTLVSPMIAALNDDKNVSLVRYINRHPELCDPMLYVEVKKGKPEEAVKKAAKAVSAYYSAIKK